jgi:anti-sigma factor RsiW
MTTFEQHIEAYLDGDLHGEAKRAFLLELERDPEKQKLLTEHQRLNAMMKENSRTAAVPLQTQRALADRIPVLKEMNPTLAPLSGAEVASPIAGGSASSTIGSSLVVKTIRIVSILGVAAVGSWYGITQFSESSEAEIASALNEPAVEISQPFADEQLGDAEISQEPGLTSSIERQNPPESSTNTANVSGQDANVDDTPAVQNSTRTGHGISSQAAIQGIAQSDPVQSSADPVQSSADPVQSSAEPIQSSAEPIQSSMEPALSDESDVGSTDIYTPAELLILQPSETVIPLKQQLHSAIILSSEPQSPIVDELNPDETSLQKFSGYLEAGGSSSEFMVTGFNSMSVSWYGSFVVGLQYQLADHFRFGVEVGRSPFTRQTLTATLQDAPAPGGVTIYTMQAGVDRKINTWLQLHGEYVLNPDDFIVLHAAGGFGSVLNGAFVPNVSIGTGAGLNLSSVLTLRLGIYLNGAWVPYEDQTTQAISTGGQGAPIGIIYSREGVGNKFSSSLDLRFGMGFKLW